jgi:hypothetical protein
MDLDFFESLRARAEAIVADAPMTRRPSCGLPLTLGAELAYLCLERDWLFADEPFVGRRWAVWFDPRNRHRPDWASPDRHVCCGFTFRLGDKQRDRQRGNIELRVAKHSNGVWALTRFGFDTRDLILRRLAAFAGSSEREIAEAAKLLVVCRCCFRALTDPISIERGIGPECFKGTGTDADQAYRDRRASEDRYERVITTRE